MSTVKLLQSSRETNTPHVYQLNVGLDTPRFPGHEVACSTKVIVTADVSTLTDTFSHSSAMTSQSRGVQVADRKSIDLVVPVPPEINWLVISPSDEVADRVETGSGIKVDPVPRDLDDAVFHQTDVSEAASDKEILLGKDTSFGQTSKTVAATCNSLDVGVEYRSLATDVALEYLTVGTNTGMRSFGNNSMNTTITADVACDTGEWRYDKTTHDHVPCSTVVIDSQSGATDTEAAPLILRRSNSLPSRPEQNTRTNHRAGTAFDTRHAERLRVMTGMPTYIPDANAAATYQSAWFDSASERIDYHHDNGHVVDSQKQVPVVPQPLCRYCRIAIDEQNSVDTKVSDNRSPVSCTDIADRERIDGEKPWNYEDREKGFVEFAASGKTGVEEELRAVTCQNQAVGSDDAFPVVERGVGSGTVWTESCGTGDGTVGTADAETSTPTVVLVDRASGTRPVRFLHKHQATDNQQTVSVGTSPAEDITSAYRGLLAAAQPRPVTVNRSTATPPAPATADRETTTEHRRLVDCGTSPAVDVTAAYRGLLDARLLSSSKVTVSRGTLTVPLPTRPVDKDTTTDCVMVDRASSPIKVYFHDHSPVIYLFIYLFIYYNVFTTVLILQTEQAKCVKK